MSEVSFLRPRFDFSNWPDNNSELLRLTKVFVNTGTLGNPEAKNVREECKKVSIISGTVSYT